MFSWKRPGGLVRFFALAMLMGSAVLAGKPFEPDAETLLLSGFETSLREADYACGPTGFYGAGATYAEGYYGKGIDLRGRTLTPGFEESAAAGQSAIFKNFGLFTYGNVLADEGTFELFVLVEDFPKSPEPNHGGLMDAFVSRFIEDGKSYLGANMRLTRGRLTWRFPIWCQDNREHWSGTFTFKPSLVKGWHHLALTWAKGEAVLYVDGRAVASCDLSGKYGLTLLHHLNHGLLLGGHVIDELRISGVARYHGDFEPNWREGARPAHAYKGGAKVTRYPVSYRPMPQGKFDAASGGLANTEARLILLEGLERKPLAFSARKTDANGLFSMKTGGFIQVSGKVEAISEHARRIHLTLKNGGEREARLECSLALPALKNETELFDGADRKRPQPFETYRDSYPCILPMTAVSDASGRWQAVALDPGFPFNDLVTARSPEAGILQGTKLVLAPGEDFTLDFVILNGTGRFGTATALDAFYGLFAKYYHMDRKNTVYHYLPLTMHWRAGLPADIQRQGYAGGYWGHGPYHTKGDETGTYWGQAPEDPSFKHAAQNEKSFKSRENLLEAIKVENRYEYDNGYGVRRYHADPDLTPSWLIKVLAPSWKAEDDPLNTGHYYKRINGSYFTDEYRNSIGKFFNEELVRYYEAGMKDYSTGWINDTIYATACMRYRDTQGHPGRSFSPDFGSFIRGAMGKQQRWEKIGTLKSRGYPMTMIADGGSFSYTLGAFSAQAALESGCIYESLMGWTFLKSARYLHGEKPLSMHTLPEKIETARRLKPAGIDPMALRGAYNVNSEYMVLFALEHALLLDPEAYLHGNQYIAEMTPLIVESSRRGRKADPGADFTGSGWVRRSGEGLRTLTICGNTAAAPAEGALRLYREYYGGEYPLVASWFGGEASMQAAGECTALDITVPARQPAAFITAGLLDKPARATVHMEGDGIDFKVTYRISADVPCALTLADFGPLYARRSLSVDGKGASVAANKVKLPQGESQVRVTWHCRPFGFTAEQWRAAELISGQKEPGFSLVSPKGWMYRHLFYRLPLGFERGTARLFEEFVRYYDAEDGVFNNMPLPKCYTSIRPNSDKWQLVFENHGKEDGVRMDVARKLIFISGPTPGACRRNAVVFLRLMDRRYPHLGCMIYSRGRKFDRTTGIQPGMFREKKVFDFFNTLPEKDFVFKPLLKPEYSELYADGRTDFSGAYTLRQAPFIIEPTYADDFVYGFTGDDEQWKEFMIGNPHVSKEE